MNPVFNIRHYKKDGFEKVCEVMINPFKGGWSYKNINHNLMYSDHRSWMYFIVLDDEIVKSGETGNPLGIQESWQYGDHDVQPKSGSTSRLGRYRNGDNTDSYIRDALRSAILEGQTVSFWAKKCPVKVIREQVGNELVEIKHTIHKDLEQAYFTNFLNQSNCLPRLNKIKK
jgi:hypothetical protein